MYYDTLSGYEELYVLGKMKAINNFYNRWENIRDEYKDYLDGGPIRSEISYVPHDYSTHCINIYNNLENLVFKKGPGELSPTELFVLNIAVILHDYDMIHDNSQRTVHSHNAKEYILNQANDMHRNILTSNVPQDLLTYIAQVVYAHSDIKEKNCYINTLQAVTRRFKEKDFSCNVRYFYLGAMLRLADELDCTIARIKQPVGEYHFSDSQADRNSFRHYIKLYLIECVRKSEKYNDTLVLYVNDRFLEKYQNFESAVVMINEVKNKIEYELNNIYENVYRVSDLTKYPCPMNIYRYVRILSEKYGHLWNDFDN